MIKRVLFAVTFLMFSVALVPASFSADKKEMEKIVKEYIEAHPEIIDHTLRNYYMAKKKKREEAMFQQSLKQRFDVPLDGSPVKGKNDARITFVEFSDFQCPYCGRALGMLKALEKKYGEKVKFVYKHFPLPMHRQAKKAAKATMAANKQGKFWEFHDILLSRQKQWGSVGAEGKFIAYAKQLGMNVEQFKKDMKDPAFDKKIESDIALGKKLQVRGTPSFFVNGVAARGFRTAQYFSKVIDTLLAEKNQKTSKTN